AAVRGAVAMAMEARVRYATSSDKTQIAFAIVGAGPPLVVLDNILAAGGLEVRFNGTRSGALYAGLMGQRTVIAFDWRNTGQSGPSKDFSLEKFIDDIEAIVEQVGLTRFDLLCMGSSCHIGLEYAALHQNRVRKLILSQPRPKGYSPLAGGGPPIGHL